MIQDNPREVLNLVARKAKEPINSGQGLINPLLHLGRPLLVVILGESRPSVTEVNKTSMINELLELSGCSTIHKLSAP